MYTAKTRMAKKSHCGSSSRDIGVRRASARLAASAPVAKPASTRSAAASSTSSLALRGSGEGAAESIAAATSRSPV
jgi:hypothetical protein